MQWKMRNGSKEQVYQIQQKSKMNINLESTLFYCERYRNFLSKQILCFLVQEGKLDYTMNNFHSSFPRLKYGKMKIKMQLETVVRHKNTQKRMQSTFCASNFQSCKMALISSSSACFSFISDKIRLYSCLEKNMGKINENLNLAKLHYFDYNRYFIVQVSKILKIFKVQHIMMINTRADIYHS